MRMRVWMPVEMCRAMDLMDSRGVNYEMEEEE